MIKKIIIAALAIPLAGHAQVLKTGGMKKITVPVLFVHGEADNFVSPRNTLENYAACTAPKQLITVPGAGHGVSYLVDRERCDREIKALFDEAFGMTA